MTTESPRRHSALLHLGVLPAVALLGALGLVGAASAATAPSAVTGPASAVGLDAVTLSGNADGYGAATRSFFEYGTTVDYGKASPEVGEDPRPGSFPVLARIGGLTPGTSYHDRLVVRSAAGIAYGADSTFATPALAPQIVSEDATSLRDTSAVVDASIIANGLATTWSVHYGVSTSYGATTAVRSAGAGLGAIALALPLAGLAPDTTYHFTVVATNASGTSTGADTTLLSLGPPTVSSGAVGDVAPTSASFTGTVNPGGHPTTYLFEYGLTTAYGADTPAAHLVATTAAQSVSVPVSGLAADTTYHLRLVASNSAGAAAGADVAFTTPGPTLSSSATSVDFGHSATLSGTLPDTAANLPVSLYARRADAPTFTLVATVLTGSGGTWAFGVAPQLQTTYEAIWRGEVSPTVELGVSPSVFLHERRGGRIVVHVAGVRSFAGALIRLQRLHNGSWRVISTKALNSASSIAFRLTLTSGSELLRAYLTGFQAGGGYLASYSGTHLFRAS